eukprot:COSAG06_NODE_4951_length_3838_cov_118.881456_7_plen_50_part_00
MSPELEAGPEVDAGGGGGGAIKTVCQPPVYFVLSLAGGDVLRCAEEKGQ